MGTFGHGGVSPPGGFGSNGPLNSLDFTPRFCGVRYSPGLTTEFINEVKDKLKQMDEATKPLAILQSFYEQDPSRANILHLVAELGLLDLGTYLLSLLSDNFLCPPFPSLRCSLGHDDELQKKAMIELCDYGFKNLSKQVIKNLSHPLSLVFRGMSPLAIAAQRRHPEIIRLFLSHGADVNQSFQCSGGGFDGGGPITRTALHIAVEIPDNTEVITALLESDKIDVDKTDEKGMTPLYIAVLKLSPEYGRLLLGAGANVNKTPKGESLLTAITLVRLAHLDDTANFLLSLADPAVPEAKRLNIFARNSHTMECILHSAANINHLQSFMVKVLNLADRLDPPNSTFVAPSLAVELSSAVLEGAGGAAKLLSARNREGLTPFHASVSKKESNAITAELLSYATRVPFINIADRKGMTPLQASMGFTWAPTQLLIDAGADVGTRDFEGKRKGECTSGCWRSY